MRDNKDEPWNTDPVWGAALNEGLGRGMSFADKQIRVAREQVEAYSRCVNRLLKEVDAISDEGDLQRVTKMGELLALRPNFERAERELNYLIQLRDTPIAGMARA